MNISNSRNNSPSNGQNIGPVINKLKKVFEYYCQFGEKFNTTYLKSHKYMKMAQECGIIDNVVNRTRLELIYKSENKNNQMNFNKFLNSLIQIAEYKYLKNKKNADLGKTKALNLLISQHIVPLHDHLFNVNILNEKNEKLGQHNMILNTHFVYKSSIITIPNIEECIYNKNVEEIFKKVAQNLFDIYTVYFPHEISISENKDFIKDKSYKNYFLLIKDFDLCPGLISKPAAFQIYQYEIMSDEVEIAIANNRDYYFQLISNVDLNSLVRFNPKNGNILGQHFNFFKFLRIILKISELGYEKLEKIDRSLSGYRVSQNNSSSNLFNSSTNPNQKDNQIIPSHEKLILALERMELSEGFLSLEMKTNKTHTTKSSSMITKDFLDLLNIKNNNVNSFAGDLSMKDNYSNMNNEEKFKNLLFHNNFREVCEMTNYIIETYGNDLFYIFKGFCSFGDPFNTKYMKSKIFSKLLMEAKLIIYNSGHNKSNSSYNMSNSLTNLSVGLKKKEIGLKMMEIDSIFIKLSALPQVDSALNVLDNINIGTNNSTHYNYNSTHNNAKSPDNLGSPGYSQNSSMCFSITTNTYKKKTGVVSNAKIDYNSFILAIEVIAKFIFPNLSSKEAVDYIIKEHLFKYLSEEYVIKTRSSELKIEYLKEKQNDEEMVLILGLVHKSFNYVYKFYSNNLGLMNFEQFMKFCIDFTVFPDLFSKSKLNSFFAGLYHYAKFENYENNKDVVEVIDQSLFVDMLGLCAFDINFPDPEPSPLEKKIAQSEGPNKILRKFGHTRLTSGESLNILDIFKVQFPDYFKIHQYKKEEFLDVFRLEETES